MPDTGLLSSRAQRGTFTAAPGGPRRDHARPSARRLDRGVREDSDRIGALAHHGGIRLWGNPFLRAYARNWLERGAGIARARANRRDRTADGPRSFGRYIGIVASRQLEDAPVYPATRQNANRAAIRTTIKP